jgi:hypothetical protein
MLAALLLLCAVAALAAAKSSPAAVVYAFGPCSSVPAVSAPTVAAAPFAMAEVLVTGPSSSATPYVVGVPGTPVRCVTSILTVGDALGGYQLLGIPDGMGAFMVGEQVKLFIDHEFTSSAASGKRAHQSGSTSSGGAFLSGWTMHRFNKC